MISAALSVLVSLATASSLTVRQARTQRAENARLRLSEIADGMLRTLAQYRANTRSSAQRDPDNAHSEDKRVATAILDVASGLGRFRWMVTRLCRRILGRFWTDPARHFTRRPRPPSQSVRR